MPDHDESQEARRNVDQVTDSEPCTDAEELVESEELKRQFREAKERLKSETLPNVERVFLTIRQELKRFQRKGLGYSKDLETHRQAVALFLGVYNFVRKHKTLGTTPAVAAGVELERWSLERVVDMTSDYLRRKEDAHFEVAFADLESSNAG